MFLWSVATETDNHRYQSLSTETDKQVPRPVATETDKQVPKPVSSYYTSMEAQIVAFNAETLN